MQKEIIISTTKEIMGTTMMTVRYLLLSFPAKPKICLHKKIWQMYVKRFKWIHGKSNKIIFVLNWRTYRESNKDPSIKSCKLLTLLNYRLSQKFKLLGNYEFNHLTIILTDIISIYTAFWSLFFFFNQHSAKQISIHHKVASKLITF